MGLVANILLAPVTGPIAGLRFVLNAIREQAESESLDVEKALQEELRALNMRLELGEISEEEFETKEAEVLEKLRESRSAPPASSSSASQPGTSRPGARGSSPER